MLKWNWIFAMVIFGLSLACQKQNGSAGATPSTKPSTSGGLPSIVSSDNLEVPPDTPESPIKSAKAEGFLGKLKHPLLFKVKPRDGGPISYLFGSVHVGISTTELPYQVIDLFDRAQTVAFEVDLTRDMLNMKRLMTDPENMNLFSAIYPNAKLNNFSTEQIAAFKKMGIPEPLARSLDPRDCDHVLIYRIYAAHGMKTLDGELLIRAHRHKKTVLPLEDDVIRAQAAQYEKSMTPNSSNECEATDYISHPEKLKEDEKEASNLQASYMSFTPEQWLSDPTYVEKPSLIYRNHYWMSTLNSLFRQKSAFVTVGGNHLRGDNGLVKLLEAAGFDVEPMDDIATVTET